MQKTIHGLSFLFFSTLMILLSCQTLRMIYKNALNSFNNYCTDWHLAVNLQKSKIVIFGARNTNIYAFNLNDQQIEIVDSYQYLGVVFSSNGSFLKARKHVVQQATKAMYALFTKSNNATYLLILLKNCLTIPLSRFWCMAQKSTDMKT